MSQQVYKIDLGCGNNRRAGYTGVDGNPGPQVDFVVHLDAQPLPFADDSVTHVYSNHALEHLTRPENLLREVVRVCRHGAEVEIWTPYGKSSAAFMIGHFQFFVEMHWEHITHTCDRVMLGDAPGYFIWEGISYNLIDGVLDRLRRQNIDLKFALAHMFDICWEWGIHLRVGKDGLHAPGRPRPWRRFYCGRENLLFEESGSDAAGTLSGTAGYSVTP
jgi:SAM-dependent methyltransferase